MRTPPNGTICPTCDTCGDHLPHRPGSPRWPEGLHLEDPPPSRRSRSSGVPHRCQALRALRRHRPHHRLHRKSRADPSHPLSPVGPRCDTLPCTLGRRRHGAREQLRSGGSSSCFSRWRACRRTSWSASSAPTGAPRSRALHAAALAVIAYGLCNMRLTFLYGLTGSLELRSIGRRAVLRGIRLGATLGRRNRLCSRRTAQCCENAPI